MLLLSPQAESLHTLPGANSAFSWHKRDQTSHTGLNVQCGYWQQEGAERVQVFFGFTLVLFQAFCGFGGSLFVCLSVLTLKNINKPAEITG